MANYSLLVNVEAIDKASAVFDKISKNADTFKKDLEGVGKTGGDSMSNLGKSMQQVGGTMTATGKIMTATVTTPIVALGTAAVKTAADFDSQMSKVQAISGATGKDLEDLRAKAREMGAKTKFSATEAGEGFEYMAMAGWKTGDMLNGIEGIMNLAAASGESLGTTSDIVTDALTAFGLSAQDSGHFADVLAAASSNANTNVSMMGETFKYAAPIAGSLGYSAEDTAVAIGLMANSGIKASQAGTSLRTIMSKLTGDIEISGKALGDVTIATANADGTMRPFSEIIGDCREAFSKLTDEEKVATAESLVGKNAMSGFLAVMNAGEADVTKLTNAVAGCDGAAKSMADTMNDNLEGQLTILNSQLQELAISFGEILIPVVRDAVGILQNVVDAFNRLSPETKEAITKVAAIAAALGPLLMVGGKLVSGIGTLLNLVPKIINLGSTISSVLSGIGLSASALGGIAAVISGVVMAVTSFVDMFVNGFNAIKEVIMTIGIALAAVGAVILGAPALVAGVVAGIVWAVANLVIVIKQHWTEISQFFAKVWDGIKTVFKSALTAIQTGMSTAWTAIKAAAQSAWDGIKAFFASTWTAITSAAQTAWEGIKTLITNTWTAIKTTVTTIVTAIQTFISTAWNTIKTVVTTILNAIKTTVTTVWNNIKMTITNVINNIKTGITTGLNTIMSTATSILNNLKNTFVNVFNGIKSHLTGVVTWLKGIFNFKWELPKIKLPHFSISGSFSLNPPSVPHFSVSWYKSAYDEAMIFQTPTIFGANGFGDGNGNEVVVGDQHLIELMRDAFKDSFGGGDTIIPVYIGQERIDEIVVRASQRQALLSGGR